MTLNELSQLYYLNREIEMDSRRLERLRSKAQSPSAPRITGMPRATAAESQLERRVAEIADISAIISAKQQRCLHERIRLERYICNIADSRTRQIFTLRFVNGLPWEQVAASIGGPLTAAYARNACYKHLRRTRERKMQKMQTDVI